jgi:hypothetical protein
MLQKDIDRFFNKVNKTNSCWNWTHSTNKFGHGMFSFQGKTLGAHRFSFELHKGPIPSDLFVCHSCDNPACVNPSHLWLGTAKDNVQDMISKNRYNNGGGNRNKRIGPKKKIKTPFGVFESRKQAAEKLGIKAPSLGDRMKRHPQEYYYI